MAGRYCVKEQLMASFYDIYELLLNGGCSSQEAMERLFVMFDWEVRGIRRVVDFREDEFAGTEDSRAEAADKGLDVAAIWIEAAEKRDGSEKFVEKIFGLPPTD